MQRAKRKSRERKGDGRGDNGDKKGVSGKGRKKIEKETEELMVGRVKRGKERWKIVGVYVGKGEMRRMLEK